MVSRRNFTPRLASLASLVVLGAQAHAIVATTGSSTPVDTFYSYVGYVDKITDANGYGGSWVAVGPNTILTAAHNLQGNPLGHSFILGSTVYSAVSVQTAPSITDTNPDDPTFGQAIPVDLSLVTVNANFTKYATLGKAVAIGSGITMSGYGPTGSSDGGGYLINQAGDVRHSGTNVVYGKQDYSDVYGDGGPILTSFLRNAGDAALTGGDSGGGWFLNGTNTLVGISDFIATTNSNLRAYGFANQNGGNPYYASAAVDLTDPRLAGFLAGANPVPEPTTVAAFALGTLAFLRRRRR